MLITFLWRKNRERKKIQVQEAGINLRLDKTLRASFMLNFKTKNCSQELQLAKKFKQMLLAVEQYSKYGTASSTLTNIMSSVWTTAGSAKNWCLSFRTKLLLTSEDSVKTKSILPKKTSSTASSKPVPRKKINSLTKKVWLFKKN